MSTTVLSYIRDALALSRSFFDILRTRFYISMHTMLTM